MCVCVCACVRVCFILLCADTAVVVMFDDRCVQYVLLTFLQCERNKKDWKFKGMCCSCACFQRIVLFLWFVC